MTRWPDAQPGEWPNRSLAVTSIAGAMDAARLAGGIHRRRLRHRQQTEPWRLAARCVPWLPAAAHVLQGDRVQRSSRSPTTAAWRLRATAGLWLEAGRAVDRVPDQPRIAFSTPLKSMCRWGPKACPVSPLRPISWPAFDVLAAGDHALTQVRVGHGSGCSRVGDLMTRPYE